MLSLLIAIPCHNEEKYIAACLASLDSSHLVNYKCRFVVIDGDSNDLTVEEASKFERFPVEIIQNSRRTAPYALNLVLEKYPEFDFFVRIDAHCIYPQDYIHRLVSSAVELRADNVGPQLNVLPASSSISSSAIAKSFSSPFGVGNSLFRVGSSGVAPADTVPFGCFSKAAIEKFGVFDVELTRNQDDEYNARIALGGGKIFLDSNIVVDYYCRPSIRKHAQLLFQYGFYKPLSNLKAGSVYSIRQLVPPIFVCYLLMSLFFAFLGVFAPLAVFLPYFSLAIYFYFRHNSKVFSIGEFLLFSVVSLVGHVSYGTGFLLGAFNFIVLRRRGGAFVKISR